MTKIEASSFEAFRGIPKFLSVKIRLYDTKKPCKKFHKASNVYTNN